MSINLLRRCRHAVSLTVAAACLGLLAASPASAATFVVHNTVELETAVTKANQNTEANTIELTAGTTASTYQPSKTLIFTNAHGTQTVAGPAGKTGEATPGVTLSGNNVKEVPEVSEKELITVKTGVTVTLKHVVVTGGGEGANAGIEDAGTLNVENATISGNIGTQIQVASGATANLTNSTLSDGHAFGLGNTEGTASFLNVTVVHNASGGVGGNTGTLSLTNTIVALNGPTATPQCSGNTITNDHSLASDASCGGEAAFQNKTPLLQTSLLNDGGSTTLYSEKAGSPTIDAGDPAKCPATDQRGYPRPDVASTACDIGADEYSPTPPTITVPAEIVTSSTGTGAVVTYSVEATDPDALVKKLECAPASGSTFKNGTTKVECKATDGHENTATASFNVTVNAAACAASPAIETQPSNQTVIEPASASFKVKEGAIPANCSAATVQWEVSTNGGTTFAPIGGATSATYTINPTHTSESGDEFRAVLTNAHGKTTSTAVTLTVNAAACAASPAIETQPSNQTVIEPASASFKVKEGAIPANCSAATVQWEVSTNGGTTFAPIGGATSATYTINPTHTSESGDEFRAVLTNAHGKTTSTAVTLTVNAAACAASPAIETQPSNQTVIEPASASFKVKEGAIPANCSAATVQWEVSTNGGTTFAPIGGATSATYTINPTHTSESGDEFRAVLTNAHGKTTSTAVTLTVNAAACAASPAIETQPSNQTVIEPASASFKVKEGAIPANCSAATVQWEVSTNGGTTFAPIGGATSATYTINPTHTSESGDEFRAVLTNAHGKTTSTAVTLTVNAAACAASPAIETQPSNQTVIEPASASFKVKEGAIPANCSAATVQWEVSTNGGTTFAPIGGATSATYTINPTHTSESGDEFRAVLTNAHGKTTSTAVTLTVNAAACAASPAIETQPSNQTVIEPASASFKVKEGAIPANCSAATVQWEVSTNGGTTFAPIGGATSATYTINPTHTSESGDEFRAVLTNAHGKTTSTAVTLTVNAAACAASPAIETQPSNQTVIEPASASFKVKEGAIPANCSAATVQWEVSTNGGTTFAPIGGATSATYTINPTHTSESGDEFRAVLTNAHGKTTSTAVTLTVNAAACAASPAIETQPSNQTVIEPASASFKVKEGAIPANCSAATVQWEVSTNGGTTFAPIGGATSATYTINPTHTSESGDEFRAVLTNAHGKTTSTAVTLTVNAAACAASPAIETQPSNQTVIEPASASFKVKEGAIPANCSAATVQWEVSTNGGTTFAPIGGATSATYTINPTHTSESGDEFRAVLTNAHGKTTSTAVTLTVNAAASIFPEVSSVVPNEGFTTGAEKVKVKGSHLAGATEVTFGGTKATILHDSEGEVEVETPAHAAGAVEVCVKTAAATPGCKASAFTYKTPPATSPEVAIHQLLQEVSSSTIPHGIRHELSCLLSDTLRSLAGLSGYGPSKCGAALLSSKATKADRHKRGHAGACDDLQQFIDVIKNDQHRRKPKIPAKLAAAWSKAASDIDASLGCTSHDNSPGYSSRHAPGHRGRHSSGR